MIRFFQYTISALLLVFSIFSFAEDKASDDNVATAISFSSTAPITIKADRLRMKNQDNQRSAQYSGNVLVTQDSFTIRADELNILSKNDKIQFMKATGNPAYVENTDKKNNLKAHANEIIYDTKSGWLQLSDGEPEVIHNKNRIKGRQIRYNLNTQDIEAESYQDRPALLVIDPNSQ